LDKVLPKLLARTLDAGKRALVLTGSDTRTESLTGLLWTDEADAWLPHGNITDGNPADQPIWLAEGSDNANDAQFLFLTDGAEHDDISGFERCFELFDGNDDEALTAARTRWKTYLDAGHTLTYWQQGDRGGWEQKN
jgi:DNA polymerase III subunit chi